jgi:ABC-type transport system substrate-binding protein
MQLPRFRRKPFLISTSVFATLLLIHLIGVYIFEWGKYVGLPGGSISIGVVGTPPDVMNPLIFGQNPANDLLFRFLFRGLITYNPQTEIAEGDLATCDLGNLAKITCTIKEGTKWSDDTSIQDDDVVATFQSFRESTKDTKIKSLLQGMSIVASKGVITFESKEKNPLVLDLLTYPIIRSDMLEQIRTNRFSSGNYISSWLFRFSEVANDAEYKFDRITLVRNELYQWQLAWLDKIHFKIFQDIGSLERSTDTLNIIIPPVNNEKLLLSARFEGYKYTTYEFFWVFFHTDRLEKSLRNGLHWQIGTSFSGNIHPDHRQVESIFSHGAKILPTGVLGNFSDILRKDGYLRKDELLANLDAEPTTVTGGVTYESTKYFQNKEQSRILFVSSATWGIILTGVVPPGTEGVNINGYTLKEFVPRSSKFVYRVSTENGTLEEGKNTYLLSFGSWAATNTGETLTIYYHPDTTVLDTYKREVDAVYLAKLNTPALIAERERKKAEKRKTLEALDDHYYYNGKYEPFRLRVAYINGPQSTEQYAKTIEATLKKLSIITELIPLEPKDLESIIKSGEKNYDLIIAWVGTAGNIARIGQLFASSEAGKWVNFSNIESKILDDLFATLRSTTTTDEVQKIKADITTFMQDESFFFPISSLLHTFYVDKNIKGVRQIDTFPDISTLYDILKSTSIKDEFVLHTEGKWFFGFFGWLGAQAWNSTSL